jgi:hypothetical protein
MAIKAADHFCAYNPQARTQLYHGQTGIKMTGDKPHFSSFIKSPENHSPYGIAAISFRSFKAFETITAIGNIILKSP